MCMLSPCCILMFLYVPYCVFGITALFCVNVYCTTATGWQPNRSIKYIYLTTALRNTLRVLSRWNYFSALALHGYDYPDPRAQVAGVGAPCAQVNWKLSRYFAVNVNSVSKFLLRMPTFRKNFSFASYSLRPWRWKQQVLPTLATQPSATVQKLKIRINITSAAALCVVYINLVYLRDVTMDSVNLTSWGRAWDADAVSSNYWMAPLDVYSTNTDDVNGIGGSVV
jgi:hypothetical protein